MKLTRDAAFRLFKTIEAIDTKIYNKYFLYAIFSNKKILVPIVDEIVEKSRKSIPEKFNEFQQKISELTSENDSELRDLQTKLIEDYSETLKEAEKNEIEFKKWINEDIEIDLKTIDFEHIPNEIDSKLYSELNIIFLEP